MKIDVHDWYTDITLTPEEMNHLCTPGKGADTCVWLVVGAEGFMCSCLHRNHSLLDRWMKGKTTAKRDGCDFVNTLEVVGMDPDEHELKVPGITE